MKQSDQGAPTSADEHLALAVIVPCHNVEATLAQQLDALVEERWHSSWGIVVVDNGSTDRTAAVARSYQGRGVRLVTANEGRGVAYARNSGVRAVHARSVAFCDGDDVVLPGWVAAMGEALQNHDIVSGGLDSDLLNPPWLAKSRPLGRPGRLPTFGQVGFASGCNCGVRTEVFDQLGGYDELFVGLEDIEFSLRAIARGIEIHSAPDAVIAYRFRSNLSAVWRQGLFYGRGRPSLNLRARALGIPAPSRLEGLRSWGWLLINAPKIRSRQGRYLWVWVLANRFGVLRGSLAVRRPFI